MQDKNNLALGETLAHGQNLTTYTLTLEDKLSANFAIRLEGRTDQSSQPVFVKQVVPVAAQTVGLLGMIASF